jgi:hypothetical protein
MILISLMLAAAPTPLIRPDDAQRRHSARARPSAPAVRSKRLIELEATVKSLPMASAEQGHGGGPQGM